MYFLKQHCVQHMHFAIFHTCQVQRFYQNSLVVGKQIVQMGPLLYFEPRWQKDLTNEIAQLSYLDFSYANAR